MRIWLLYLILVLPTFSWANEMPQRMDTRFVPGEKPTALLRLDHPSARAVQVATSSDHWSTRYPMEKREGIWSLDVRPMNLPFGRHEYKFIVDGEWEPGENRILHVNENGLLERPPDVIVSAFVQNEHLIEVTLRGATPSMDKLRVQLDPEVAIKDWRMTTPPEEGFVQGYAIRGDTITFFFNPDLYGIEVGPNDLVVVAGNFNQWDPSGRQGTWQLRNLRGVGIWEVSAQLSGLRPPRGEEHLDFKFVINRTRWLAAPDDAPNAANDGRGNINLRVDRASRGAGRTLRITTEEPLRIDQNYMLLIDGLAERRAYKMTSPGTFMDQFVSDKPLGVTLDRDNNATTYRLFAPRATRVYLCFFDRPEYEIKTPTHQPVEPSERYLMWKDETDGVWELSTIGLDIGRYYSFNVEGPAGDGEGFHPTAQIGDPYALAAAVDSDYNTIVLDPYATNRWFSGWTDQDFVAPRHEDMVIYEMHIRDMTMHPSSKVPPSLRGTYEGLLASVGTGTGLDHLKDLGVNMIEFLPMQEFNNPGNRYDWGYATVFFFAPEASFGRSPATGSQFYEFKHVVNELHNQGFGVMLDVVYNHLGTPNIFSLIDRKYYFRLNPDYTFSNFSGVGNDVRSEAPMMRRLIIENVLYLMREFHIDGFRFDLAELIDMETLLQLREEAIKINPNVLLVSEPWSFRGTHKYELTGTGWSAWNDYFRNGVKGFVMGERNIERMKEVLIGSGDLWTANPIQTVNYVESHDDMTLMDELTTRPDRDGRYLQPRDVAANRLAATALFTSLGIPMLQSGQEFLRSKHGVSNTYNRGDELNALRWNERDRPVAAQAMEYYKSLIALRQSPQGKAFRVSARPPNDYYRWIDTNNDQAFGYIVNSPRRHPGNGFIVLLNASHAQVTFNVDFPSGNWRLIGNGSEINMEGLRGGRAVNGPAQGAVHVPGMSSVILMDGF